MTRASAKRHTNGRYYPTINGEMLVPSIAKDGFYMREPALALARKWKASGYRPEPHAPFQFPEPEPVTYPTPKSTPQPVPYDGPLTRLQTQPNTPMHFTASDGFGGIYEPPSCFSLSESKGSTICLTGPGDDHNHPANVSNIQLVRLIDARAKYRKPKTPIPASPYDEGEAARLTGKPKSSCPYTIHAQPDQWDEWMDGYTEFSI